MCRPEIEFDAAWNLNWRTNDQFKQQFQVNNRNELTGSSRSGTLAVSGTAGLRKSQWEWDAGVTNVTVSGTGLSSGAADLYEDGTWAKRGATLQNGNNSYTALAKDTLGRESSDTVSVYSPSSVTFTYDLNGNLTGDGLRVFEYDYENQLTNVYVANQWKSEFAYDALMRRRVRKEYAWSGSAWVKTNEVRYVYDGRLVIQERDENNVPRVTYTRGLDLSGSLEGAGGIGGLLARSEISNFKSPHSYYHSDGNGNITCMVDGNGTVVVRYAYDPYGNVLSMSGSLAEANLYRFSSKEAHQNSGLVYYLYRYYEPNLQRWINQDPIKERGGINLFSFVKGQPITRIDLYGHCDVGLLLEFEAAGIVGWDASAGVVIDSENLLDSGLFISGGPAFGATAGAGVGGFYSTGNIEGEAVNLDGNAGPVSISVSASTDGSGTGIAFSLGDGGGLCASQTQTATLSIGAIGNWMSETSQSIAEAIQELIIVFGE